LWRADGARAEEAAVVLAPHRAVYDFSHQRRGVAVILTPSRATKEAVC
jgi:hypothetical protein